MERDQKSRDSKAARKLTQLSRDVSYMLVTTSSESVELTKSLLAAQRLANINLPQESITSSLVYSGMANRQGMIMPPEHCTYDWIFETTSTAPEPVNFMPWLENGDGVFWITGKAESGKSTLMKHISTTIGPMRHRIVGQPAESARLHLITSGPPGCRWNNRTPDYFGQLCTTSLEAALL
jgi:hypothetical protein